MTSLIVRSVDHYTSRGDLALTTVLVMKANESGGRDILLRVSLHNHEEALDLASELVPLLIGLGHKQVQAERGEWRDWPHDQPIP